MLSNVGKAVVAIIVFMVLLKYTTTRFSRFWGVKSTARNPDRDAAQERQNEKPGVERVYRDMYFKLHNIEKHPEVIDQGRSFLQASICEALQIAHRQNHPILRVVPSSDVEIDQFVQAEQEASVAQWREYLQRRASGQGREMLLSADEAKRWLVQRAPMKFVDGAWLGYIHRATAPYATRFVTKDLWQILSEEIGDGDLQKSHVYIFQQLLRDLGHDLGPADSREFANNSAIDDPCIWKASVLQLLISLYPAEFLPEVLGYNMHFEMIALDTLIAAEELRELKIDPTYFNLHISIDNAHSGHTAMASTAVMKYLKAIRADRGDAAVQSAWTRIQAGYALSSCFMPGEKGLPSSWYSSLADDVLAIFRAKIKAADGIHDACPVRVGTKPLSEWINPQTFESEACRNEFLTTLSNSRPWVYKGASSRSRLVRSMLWEGRMFGAFTEREVAKVRDWIDSLCEDNSKQGSLLHDYSSSSSSAQQPSNMHGDATTPLDMRIADIQRIIRNFGHVEDPGIPGTLQTSALQLTIATDAEVKLERLIPLWMAHPCLLESWVSVPWRITSSEGWAVVRLLRTQHGFTPECSIVEGIDEVHREDSHGLVDIGLDIINQAGSAPPRDLDEVLRWWPSPFAYTLAALALQPQKYKWRLFGLMQACVHLHQYLSVHGTIMSPRSRAALVDIGTREQTILDALRHGQDPNGPEARELHTGYAIMRTQIAACFE